MSSNRAVEMADKVQLMTNPKSRFSAAMVPLVGRPPRFELLPWQPDHRFGKSRDGGHGLVERHRRAWCFTDDGRKNTTYRGGTAIERGKRVADRAEIAARNQDERKLQRHHDIEYGLMLIERNHDAADALDQQNVSWRCSIALCRNR